MVECVVCHLTFSKKSQLDQHRQNEHQMCAVVKYTDGSIHNIEREPISMRFTCARCDATFKRPKAIQRHALRACISNSTNRPPKRAVATLVAKSSSSDLLCRLGLSVDKHARAVLCLSCQYCVGPGVSQIRSHILRIHECRGITIPTLDEIEEVLKTFDLASEQELLAFGIGRDDLVEPIRGLQVHHGVMCEECKFLCCCKRTMKRHIKASHRTADVKSVELQTLFIGPRKRFFRVRVAVNSGNTENSHEKLRQEVQKFNSFLTTVGSDDNDETLVSPLLRQLRWHKRLPQYTDQTCSELMKSCKFTVEFEVEQNLYAALSFFFENGMKMFDATSYLTRRYILAGGLDVSSAHKGFGPVTDASGTYQRHMAKLIHMVAVGVDMNNNQTPLWKFTTSSATESSVKSLRRVCSISEFVAGSDEVQHEVNSVLEAIFITESDAQTHQDDFKMYTVYRYIVCSSIIGGELRRITIREPNNITSICAALVYWARLFVLVSVASGMRPITEFLYYIQDGVPTGFNALLEVMKLGKCLSGPSEGQKPNVHWINDEQSSLVCKTATVTKEGLQEMASSMLVSVKGSLQVNLFRGYDTSKVRAELESKHLIDDINARTDGSWFMTRPENQLSLGPRDLLEFLGSNTCMEPLWSNGNRNTWDDDRVKIWLMECDEFMDDLTILVHLAFGQPARASELATLRVRDNHLEFRSVYAIRNRFTLIQMYHKSMNVTAKFKPIARFAPASLNADIILYFHLIRPVQAFLYRAVFPGRRSPHSYLEYFFVKDGMVMNAERIRRSIAKGFAKFSDMRLDVSTYRHVSVALIDPHLRDRRDSVDLYDEQAGHSRETASTVYARSDNDPSSLSRDQLHKFWIGSRKWQTFLGLIKVQTAAQNNPTNDLVPIDPQAKSAIDNLSKQIAQVASTLSKVKTHVSGLRSGQTGGGTDRLSFPPISAEAFERAKHVVEQFTGSATASFLSMEQGIAVALLVSDPLDHRLIVLPTGGGKSILYMAHFLANPKSIMTTVVIIPTAALLTESVSKAKQHAISSCRFSRDLKTSGKRFNLVFAAVEHIGQDDFREYMELLKARKSLHYIFVDEAHLVVTALSYRPQMAYVSMLTSVGAPIVLLSATVPVKMERDLASTFGIDFRILRSTTNRENIAYSVKEVAKLQDTVILAMQKHQVKYQGSRNRGLAYCATRREADRTWKSYEIKTGFTASRFHAGMDQKEKAKCVAEWKSGTCIWMIATNAFGVGIDYPSVRIVLHVGAVWSLIDYAQETGRAGRDGDSCLAMTLTNRQYQGRHSRAVNEHTRTEYSDMTKYLNDAVECRRQRLQLVLDGYGFPCISDSSNELCDVCNDLSRPCEQAESVFRGSLQIDSDARAASSRNSSDRIIHGALCEFLELLPENSCPVCWIDNKVPNHGDQPCNCLKLHVTSVFLVITWLPRAHSRLFFFREPAISVGFHASILLESAGLFIGLDHLAHVPIQRGVLLLVQRGHHFTRNCLKRPQLTRSCFRFGCHSVPKTPCFRT